MECSHESFLSNCNVYRLTEGEGGRVSRFSAELTIECVQCCCQFQFIGVPMGSAPDYPTRNFDRTELRIPIEPFRDN
jgi:hypothetical protein